MAFNYNESVSQGGSSSSSQSGTLPWYNTMVQNLLGQGQQAAKAPWQVYQGQRVAGFSPDQQTAFENLRGQIGDWQPSMQQASQATGQALGSLQGLQQSPYTQNALGAYGQAAGMAQFDPAKQQQFMNPYISNVTNEIARLGNENFQNNILSSLNSNFTDAGQFGSARQMAMSADAAAKAQREISGQQGQALFQAQNQAGQQYGDWANRGIGAQQSLGTANMGVNQFLQGLGTATGALGAQYGQLGQMGQQMGFADTNALLGIGNQQQALQQQQLTADQAKLQEQNQAPWQQLGQWSNLFKVPTPQQSTSSSASSNTSNSWATNFKRGGLVQMAEGGAFDWQISPEEQGRRDGMRLSVLMREANEYPNDPDLMYELKRMGVDVGNLVPQIEVGSPFEDVLSDTIPVRHDTFDTVSRSPLNNSDLARRMFDERIALLERARQAPEFAPVPERSAMGRAGEAMLRASAMGPANYGQLIGRAGASYFDQLANEVAENKNRALQRLALEEKIAPEVPRTLGGLGLGGRGASDQYVFVRGSDGKSYMVNRLDPSQRQEVGSGANMNKITEAADKYATLATKEGLYKSVEEKEADYNRFKQQYIFDRLGESGGGQSSEKGESAPVRSDMRSGNSTLIQTPGEKKSDEKIGEETGKQYASMQEGAVGAQSTLNSLSAMEEALKGYDTGKFTPALTAVSQWFDDLGIKTDKNLGAKEAFAAGIKDLALSLKNAGDSNKMPGAMSDADRLFLERMAPSLANTPEGNRLIIEMYKRLAKRQIEIAQLARKYKNREGGRGYDERFLDEAQAYAEEHPLFEDLRKQSDSGQKSRSVTVDY